MQETEKTVKCSHCGRRLAEIDGAEHVRARCADCARMTYFSAKRLDKDIMRMLNKRAG